MAFSRSITVVTCINSSFFLLKNMISLHGYPVLKITTHKLLDSECLHHSVALNDTSFSSYVCSHLGTGFNNIQRIKLQMLWDFDVSH